MSATIYLYKYAPEAEEFLREFKKCSNPDDPINEEQRKNNYMSIDLTYHKQILSNMNFRSNSFKNLERKWKDRIIKTDIPFWYRNNNSDTPDFYKEHKIIPVKGLHYYSSYNFRIKSNWFKKKSWYDTLITKKSITNWMYKYIKKTSWSDFRNCIIDRFEESNMILEISW